jgi:ADP-ribose pyrophosphatase
VLSNEQDNTPLSPLADYFRLAKTHPSLFINPPSGGFTILLDEEEIREAETQMSQMLSASGKPAQWARVGIVYRDQYLLLLRDAVRFPNGFLGTYIRFVSLELGVVGVAVLPVYQQKIVLIRHFRHATRDWHLEIPRGFSMEASSEEDAKRELEEEINATASRLTPLGQVHPDTGMSSGLVALFYAELEAYGYPETDEAITEIFLIPLLDFERMIRENEITDGFTLAAYARAKALGLFSGY